MPLAIRDGYTVPFATKSQVLNRVTGEPIYTGLPVITGRYRPALYETRQTFNAKYAAAKDGETQARLVAEFIAARVVDWDVTFAERADSKPAPAPVTAAWILAHMPDPFPDLILEEVSKWAPGESQAADEGN